MSAPNTIEKDPNQLGRATDPVRIIEHLEDAAGNVVTAAGTATLASLLSTPLDTDIAAVTLIVDPTGSLVNYNPVGVATPSSAALFPGVAYTAYGRKAKLDLIQLLGADAVTVIQHTLIPDA